MSALHPNVPDAPGVPPVARNSSNMDSATETILSSSGNQLNATLGASWGLYNQDGSIAVDADNVIAIEVAQEARISDYPIEAGSFGSYNKVIVPYDVRLIMSKGGSIEDREAFLSAVESAWLATTLYNVVTPEQTYLDVNVVSVRRTASADRGANLPALEIGLRKVRQTATVTYSKSKDAAGASAVNDGSVQASSSMQTTGTPR